MKNHVESSSHIKLIAMLLVFGYIFLMLGNGLLSLTHPDEVFYAQTAKEMISHHTWMTPYIFDKPQFEKPIFFFWLLRAAVQLFGMTPFVARFWPAFFGMIGIVITYWITWMLFGSKRTAFLSGIILGSSFLYVTLSRALLTDMVFTILVVISIGFFYFAYRYPARKEAGMILCFFFAGLAVLTKAALGFLFPAAVILGFLYSMRDLKFLKGPGVFWGMLLLTAMTLPWHALMIKLYGKEFLWEYIYNIHIRRLIEAEHPKCDTWYFYPGTLIGGTMPWTLFLFPALAMLLRVFRRREPETPQMSFLVIWVMGIFMYVQPAHSKLASYAFPAFPPLVIIIAYYLNRAGTFSKKTPIPRGVILPAYILSGVLVIAAVGSIVFSKQEIDFVGNLMPFHVFSGLLLVTAGAVAINAYRRHGGLAVYWVNGVTVSLLALLYFGQPYAEPWVSCKPICDVFNQIDHSSSVILTSKFYARGVRFYTDRNIAVIDINGEGFYSPHPVPFLNTDQKVLAFLSSQPVTYGIVKESSCKDLQRITEEGKMTLTLLKDIGGKQIIKIEPVIFNKPVVK